MPAPALSDLQRWMLTVMTAPGGLHDGLARARERFGLDERHVVDAGFGAPPQVRLDIYAQGYLLRLLECLRADFPALRVTMGEALFDFFARAYLLRHPSVSTTLFDLGAGFGPFLRSTRSTDEADPAFLLALDLATLERARTEVIRAEGLEGQTRPALDPWGLFAGDDRPLRTAPCLRLVSLSHPLIGLLEAVDREEEPEVPAPRPTEVAVSRVNFRVHMTELEPWQAAFLRAVQAGAGGLRACAERAAAESGEETEALLARLVLWLPVAQASGYLDANA